MLETKPDGAFTETGKNSMDGKSQVHTKNNQAPDPGRNQQGKKDSSTDDEVI